MRILLRTLPVLLLLLPGGPARAFDFDLQTPDVATGEEGGYGIGVRLRQYAVPVFIVDNWSLEAPSKLLWRRQNTWGLHLQDTGGIISSLVSGIINVGGAHSVSDNGDSWVLTPNHLSDSSGNGAGWLDIDVGPDYWGVQMGAGLGSPVVEAVLGVHKNRTLTSETSPQDQDVLTRQFLADNKGYYVEQTGTGCDIMIRLNLGIGVAKLLRFKAALDVPIAYFFAAPVGFLMDEPGFREVSFLFGVPRWHLSADTALWMFRFRVTASIPNTFLIVPTEFSGRELLGQVWLQF